jgi:glucan phosphoethanolaminetransferase (alkaline phosphatase superfamily)
MNQAHLNFVFMEEELDQMKADTMMRDHEENAFYHILHLKYQMYMYLFPKSSNSNSILINFCLLMAFTCLKYLSCFSVPWATN